MVLLGILFIVAGVIILAAAPRVPDLVGWLLIGVGVVLVLAAVLPLEDDVDAAVAGVLVAGRFRKKPVEIDAMRLDGDNADAVAEWCSGTVVTDTNPDGSEPMSFVQIATLEGTMQASPGDWVIRGVQGEFYPCKPDIFDATYDRVESA